MPNVVCLCGQRAVLIASGEVNVYRCTGCFDSLTRCVVCQGPVGGVKDSEWLELKCRNPNCGHETNIRKLVPPAQVRLFPEVSVANK